MRAVGGTDVISRPDNLHLLEPDSHRARGHGASSLTNAQNRSPLAELVLPSRSTPGLECAPRNISGHPVDTSWRVNLYLILVATFDSHAQGGQQQALGHSPSVTEGGHAHPGIMPTPTRPSSLPW